MQKFKPVITDQLFLLPPSIEDFVPDQKEAESFNLTTCLSKYWEFVKLVVVKEFLEKKNTIILTKSTLEDR